MRNTLLITFWVILFIWGCSSGDKINQAQISGTLSIAESYALSDSTDIAVTITQEDTVSVDTLFHSNVDTSGKFSGTIEFSDKGRYPMTISNNNQDLGQIGVILADKDTLTINGQFPDLEQTLSISSREHDAMATYQRVNRNFQRVMQAARAGQIQGDTLEQEIDKWSNLYWEVYEGEKGTRASELAASESIRLLQGWNNVKMMDHIRSVQGNDALVNLGATYGKNYLANSQGLESSLAYLDTLSNITEEKEMNMRIQMERIKLLYDSAYVDEARENLEAFQQKFTENSSAQEWAETVSYDINYLSPGDSIPEFEFAQNGQVFSRDSLIGSSYILELTNLSNSLYQDQFDRTVVIHSIYKNYGIDVITLPLDESQVTVNAFFDERVRLWPVADAQTFDRQNLLEKFNIQLVPSRFLVNKEGRIVRKYVGNEYDDIIQGIQSLINQEKEPAS